MSRSRVSRHLTPTVLPQPPPLPPPRLLPARAVIPSLTPAVTRSITPLVTMVTARVTARPKMNKSGLRTQVLGRAVLWQRRHFHRARRRHCRRYPRSRSCYWTRVPARGRNTSVHLRIWILRNQVWCVCNLGIIWGVCCFYKQLCCKIVPRAFETDDGFYQSTVFNGLGVVREMNACRQI